MPFSNDVLIRNNVKLIGKGDKTLFLAHGFGCDQNMWARRILNHASVGFPRDTAVCKDAYKFIARMAHPDKNQTRDAYHCAIAEIVMDTAQRASDMIASASSLDRSAFHPLPTLESTQFYAMVDAHTMAKVAWHLCMLSDV